MSRYVLAIDQGTTSSRAMVFDEKGAVVAKAQREFPQHFPESGWVEHDPEDIWQSVLAVCREAIHHSKVAPQIQALGLTNQRETTVIWDRQTGQPIYPAIVWQDRRTAETCARLKDHESEVQKKTGLLMDPYFSASKIAWILDHVEGARQRAERGELAFGTIDSFLIWRLTEGQRHVTDVTNASRTLLFNLHTLQWDSELLALWKIPEALLPEVLPNCADFGSVHPRCFGLALPITGVAGDQQAASIGQACFEQGMVKSTYGTGCFVLLNTGSEVIQSQHRLLSTVLFHIQDQLCYGLEGSIFNAGTTVKWARDQLHLIHEASETETIAASIPDTQGVYLVPAFTGLGAPHWRPEVRGALFGLTRQTGRNEIVRAVLESVVYQTRDLLEAIQKEGVAISSLRVDGGMTVNHWFLQFLSDILNLPVERPDCTESSARGVAYLAGLQLGWYTSLTQVAALWEKSQDFQPKMSEERRAKFYVGWQEAVRCLTT